MFYFGGEIHLWHAQSLACLRMSRDALLRLLSLEELTTATFHYYFKTDVPNPSFHLSIQPFTPPSIPASIYTNLACTAAGNSIASSQQYQNNSHCSSKLKVGWMLDTAGGRWGRNCYFSSLGTKPWLRSRGTLCCYSVTGDAVLVGDKNVSVTNNKGIRLKPWLYSTLWIYLSAEYNTATLLSIVSFIPSLDTGSQKKIKHRFRLNHLNYTRCKQSDQLLCLNKRKHYLSSGRFHVTNPRKHRLLLKSSQVLCKQQV